MVQLNLFTLEKVSSYSCTLLGFNWILFIFIVLFSDNQVLRDTNIVLSQSAQEIVIEEEASVVLPLGKEVDVWVNEDERVFDEMEGGCQREIKIYSWEINLYFFFFIS